MNSRISGIDLDGMEYYYTADGSVSTTYDAKTNITYVTFTMMGGDAF
jgi:hypothetical protein